MYAQTIRYLALGDSYTIGEGVKVDERWPNQLTRALQSFGLPISDPQVIARTGWTTNDLIAGVDAAGLEGLFTLVSLQIGVNNQYQGSNAQNYRLEFRALLKRAVAFTGGEAARVMVLSIPDWSITPFAGDHDRDQIAAEIEVFNAINRAEGARLGAFYIDVTSISRRAGRDEGMLAPDHLHPSGEMYALWVDTILPTVFHILGVKLS